MGIKKTVLITGSNRGLGKATLEAFAKNGYNCIPHIRKLTDETKAFFDSIKTK